MKEKMERKAAFREEVAAGKKTYTCNLKKPEPGAYSLTLLHKTKHLLL